MVFRCLLQALNWLTRPGIIKWDWLPFTSLLVLEVFTIIYWPLMSFKPGSFALYCPSPLN
jgi:hypothetical protein